MSEEPHNPTEGEATPVFPAGTRPRSDRTMKLDMAIAKGNISLPSHFGRYQVLKRIGIGGFASVYSAFDPELDSEVAIKVLAENHSANTAVRQRFVAEARVARRLGNERLIGVFDLGETDDGRPYVVMELAPRGTLRQRIVRTGRPSRGDLVRLINELGACLTAIHGKGVVHRDIKPSNLLFRTEEAPDFLPGRLIEDDERLVLADFGLARDISDGASALTVGGGTEGYMAPEQASTDGKPDYRADIFSATVVVAEMTTGRHPERLDLATADISTDMLEALTRSMSIDREQRPTTADEWCQLLATAYAEDANTSYPRPIDHEAQTEHLDTTRVGEPALPATDIQTDIPHTGIEAVSYTPAARNQEPPPPPGLPIPVDQQPPPAEQERPNAIRAAARAQAEAEQREAEQKAAKRAARRRGRSQPDGRTPGPPGGPAPVPPNVAPGPNPGPASMPMPTEPGPSPAPALAEAGPAAAPAGPGPASAQVQPPPPVVASTPRPLTETLGPDPAAIDHAIAAELAGSATSPVAPSSDLGTTATPPTPPVAPTSRTTVESGGPPGAPLIPGPREATSVPGSATGGVHYDPVPAVGQPPGGSPALAAIPTHPGPTPTNGPPAGGPTSTPTTGPDGASPAVPAVPAKADTSEVTRRRSRQHMKTAGKLAKLERKQSRKLARRARRRRRRLRVVNFFLAIIRGVLAGGLTLIAGYLIAFAMLGDQLEQRPGPQGLIVVVSGIAFLWGLSYFPFPRSYDV